MEPNSAGRILLGVGGGVLALVALLGGDFPGVLRILMLVVGGAVLVWGAKGYTG